MRKSLETEKDEFTRKELEFRYEIGQVKNLQRQEQLGLQAESLLKIQTLQDQVTSLCSDIDFLQKQLVEKDEKIALIQKSLIDSFTGKNNEMVNKFNRMKDKYSRAREQVSMSNEDLLYPSRYFDLRDDIRLLHSDFKQLYEVAWENEHSVEGLIIYIFIYYI